MIFTKDNFLDLKNMTDKDLNKLDIPGKVIANGGLVLFPTETVYGLGANGLDENAVKKIYEAKGRKSDNPLILHIADFDMVDILASKVSPLEKMLMEAFWPGPFTIILDRKPVVPNCVTGGLDTVGVRMPSNEIARELIRRSGTPIAAPSANISGRPSGTNIEDIFEELAPKVDYIIDGGECQVGLESTVVRVIDDIPTILRPGKITPANIKEVCGRVKIDGHVMGTLKEGEQVLSPGMKYRHYAPKSKCVLVYSEDNSKLVDEIKKQIAGYRNPLVLVSNENLKHFDCHKLSIGETGNLNSIAKNIFKALRQVDKFNPDIVFIEGAPQEGIGLAIMNRLIRACEHNYIEIK